MYILAFDELKENKKLRKKRTKKNDFPNNSLEDSGFCFGFLFVRKWFY